MHKLFASLIICATVTAQGPCFASDAVKIGFITTLSGPGGYLGEDQRDGFLLAIKEGDGRLGGVPVSVTVEDDGLKPGDAKQTAKRMRESGIHLFSGLVFSNVAATVVPEIVDNDAFMVTSNAAPSLFAGKGCRANFFSTGAQVDTTQEVVGINANRLGFKNMYVIVPNYQAGKDAVAGFRRYFKGNVIGEIYTKLDQTDFSAELAKLEAAKPDAVYAFEPGGLAVTFIKQYSQSGLQGRVPLLFPGSAMDMKIVEAVGERAQGILLAVGWNYDFKNDASAKFVANFQKAYGRPASYFASNAYDAAHLIGSALKAVGGNVAQASEFRAALEKADFVSVRGPFRFARNHMPIQDWYAAKIVLKKDALGIETGDKIASDHVDTYVQECKLRTEQ